MFALIRTSDNEVIQEVEGSKRFRSGVPPKLMSEKGLKWLPLVVVDPTPSGPSQIKEGPTVVVTATEVTKTWTVRALTAAEITARQNGQAAQTIAGMSPLILALNDGSFVPGQNLTNTQLRNIIKEHI